MKMNLLMNYHWIKKQKMLDLVMMNTKKFTPIKKNNTIPFLKVWLKLQISILKTIIKIHQTKSKLDLNMDSLIQSTYVIFYNYIRK